MTSEVSQLSEMNAVLISSKEENERRRQEAAQKAAKIAEVIQAFLCALAAAVV